MRVDVTSGLSSGLWISHDMHACKEYVKTNNPLAVGIFFNISLEWSKKVYYRLWTADDVIHSFIHMFDNAGCKPMMA